MMKAKISANMISFIAVRRGEWVLKISVFKNSQVLVLAQNVYDIDTCLLRCFNDQGMAADFIEQLVIEE